MQKVRSSTAMDARKIVKYLYRLYFGQPALRRSPTVDEFKLYFKQARAIGNSAVKRSNKDIIDLLEKIHVRNEVLPKNDRGLNPLEDPSDFTIKLFQLFLQVECRRLDIDIDDSGSSGISVN